MNAFGGNASSIPPSQGGYQSGAGSGAGHDQHHKDCLEVTGKVNGIVYDRFGDFEGFLFLSETGVRTPIPQP